MTENETPRLEGAITGRALADRSEELYAKLRKFSQRALARELAWKLAWRDLVVGDLNAIAFTLKELREWEKSAKLERACDSSKRFRREYERLKASDWRKPRKKRRKPRKPVLADSRKLRAEG